MTDEELIEDVGGDRRARVGRRASRCRSRARSSTRSRSRRSSTTSTPGDGGERPGEDGNGWTVVARRQRGRARSCCAVARSAREAVADGARPGRPVRHDRRSGPRSAASPRRCSPATAAGRRCADPPARPAARRRARCSGSGSTSSATLAVSLDGTYLYRPGAARLGQDLSRRADDRRAASRPGRRSASPRRATRRSTTCWTRSRRCAPRRASTFTGFKWGDTEYDGGDQIETTTTSRRSSTRRRSSSPARPGSSRARSIDGALDVLVIDEAGQISLADALAMGTSAESLILLGDPLQLAQVTQGVHPPGSGASRARAPARRARDDPRGSRDLPRAEPAHAPGGLRVRLGGVLRGPARLDPGVRRAVDVARRRDPLARGRPRGEPRRVGGGGRTRSRRRSRSVLGGTFADGDGRAAATRART